VIACFEYVSNSTSTTYEDVDHEVNNNWELVNSRHLSEPKKLKEPGKHLTFPNSKTFVTSSRFSMLAYISESDRSDEVLRSKIHSV
jgi:hypothetical protein